MKRNHRFEVGFLVALPYSIGGQEYGLVVKVPKKGNHVGVFIPALGRYKMFIQKSLKIKSKGSTQSSRRAKIERQLLLWADENNHSIENWRLKGNRLIVRIVSDRDDACERKEFKINEDAIIELASFKPEEEKK